MAIRPQRGHAQLALHPQVIEKLLHGDVEREAHGQDHRPRGLEPQFSALKVLGLHP